MRERLRSRPIGWITAFGTLAAMVATLVVVAPGGATPGPGKTFETSFEANCVLAPGVLNQKGVIRVHYSGEGPATLERHDEFSLHHNMISVVTPKEWGELFFSVGSRSVKGFVLSTIIDNHNSSPAKKNIAQPPEFPTGLPIKTTLENREVEFTVPSEGRSFEVGPWVVTGVQGEEFALTLSAIPGFREVSSGHFESTGEGILSEITGFDENGEADVGPVQVACTAPENVVVYSAPIVGEGATTGPTVGPCGRPYCPPETTRTTLPTTTTSRCPGGPDCGGPLNDKLTGSVTVHKLRQSITLPEGCTFRGIGEIPGLFEANTKCPPFTAELQALRRVHPDHPRPERGRVRTGEGKLRS